MSVPHRCNINAKYVPLRCHIGTMSSPYHMGIINVQPHQALAINVSQNLNLFGGAQKNLNIWSSVNSTPAPIDNQSAHPEEPTSLHIHLRNFLLVLKVVMFYVYDCIQRPLCRHLILHSLSIKLITLAPISELVWSAFCTFLNSCTHWPVPISMHTGNMPGTCSCKQFANYSYLYIFDLFIFIYMYVCVCVFMGPSNLINKEP
jgi:hypothetical protein